MLLKMILNAFMREKPVSDNLWANGTRVAVLEKDYLGSGFREREN